jgi:hypothetical protein
MGGSGHGFERRPWESMSRRILQPGTLESKFSLATKEERQARTECIEPGNLARHRPIGQYKCIGLLPLCDTMRPRRHLNGAIDTEDPR